MNIALVETSGPTMASQNTDEHIMNSSDMNGSNQSLSQKLSLLASLSQDIFTLITTFLPLSILPLLRSVNHSINQAVRHPHCYSRYVHSIQSFDELERLVEMYPSVRSFQCDGTVFRSSQSDNQSVEACVHKLTQLFPHLMSLSISNFTLTDSHSLAQIISMLRLSSLSFESLQCTTEDLNLLITALHPSLQELSLLDMTVDYSTCQLISQLRLRKLNVSRCPLINDDCFRLILGLDEAVNISINSSCLIEYVLEHLDDADDDMCFLPTSQSNLSRSISLASQLSARSLDQSGSITPTNNLAIRRAVSTPSLQSLLRPVNQMVNQTNSFFRDWSPLSQHMRTIVTHHQSNSQSSIDTSDDDDNSPFSCQQSATLNRLNQLVKRHQPSNLAQSINQLIVSHDRQLTDLSCTYLAFAHLSNIRTHKQHCLCDTDVNHLHPQTMDESFLSYMLDLIDAPPFHQSGSINTCLSFPLQHIDLSYVANLTDQSIDLITHLPHMQSLRLSNNQLLTDHSILTIGQCHWLLHLALGGLTFSEQGLLSLSQLTNLQSIKLSRLNGPSISMPLAQSTNQSINRSINQSINLGLTDRVVFGLVQLPHLSHMSIKQCENITDATARSIHQAVNISTLIIAQSNRLTALGFRLLGRAPMLKVLSVRGCRGFDQSVKQEIQTRRPGLLID